ncbi:MAG: hypothetical protein LBU03_04935 [Tannerellaceae bacterium]|jgi:hypothetical protein|nr:hypothetical protein [Tannerellaceae bacterium]
MIKKSEKDYWQHLFGELSKYSFIVVCLAGVALMFTSPEKENVLKYGLMTAFGALLTIMVALIDSLFSKMDSHG